jgi:hypothetical protein
MNLIIFSVFSDGRRLYRFHHQSLVDHLRQVYAGVDRHTGMYAARRTPVYTPLPSAI